RRPVRRLRQPRHPRPRRAGLHALRLSRLDRRHKGQPRRQGRPAGPGRPAAGWQHPGRVLRGARRRSGSRPATMAEAPAPPNSMTSRSRLFVLLVSSPLIALVIVGGLLGRMASGAESYNYLKVFHEVVGLVLANYVEEVEPDRIMTGAMRGLANGLDPDSAWLTPEQAQIARETGSLPAGSVGLELTRQYYLRVIAAQDGSPAARAGLTTGDYIRAINGESTRDMSVWEGQR